MEALELSSYLSGNNTIVSLGQVLFKHDAIPSEWIENPLSLNGADDYYLIFMMLLRRQKMVEHRKILYYHVFTGRNLSADYDAMWSSVFEMLDCLVVMDMLTDLQANVVRENIAATKNKEKNLMKKYTESIWKERQDNMRLIYLYEKCLKNLEAGYSFDSYINTFKCKYIAVYGAGRMGKHFMYWMGDHVGNIELLIDRKQRGYIYGVPVVGINEAKQHKERFDIIIVTPLAGRNEIIEELELHFDCVIIPLESVIYNMSCQLLQVSHKAETNMFTNDDGG